jgi:hypothetical protein
MRDAALVPGSTAGQWDLRGKLVTLAGILALLVCVLVAVGLDQPEKSTVAVSGAAVCIVCLILGRVLALVSARRTLEESRMGYSTVNDVPGLELRHPRTGALVRGRDTPVHVRPTRRVYDGISFTKDNDPTN